MPSEIAVSLAQWSLLGFLAALREGEFRAWAVVILLVVGLSITAIYRGNVTSGLPDDYNSGNDS